VNSAHAATLLWGQPSPPLPPRPLRAGPLTMLFDPETAFLRLLRLGDREVLRGIYAAVRDAAWNTAPPSLSSLVVEDRADAFRITFHAEHRLDDIHFQWRGTIEGGTDGAVRFVFDGEALSEFQTNRVGFCVLHPIAGCAGQPCRLTLADGRVIETRFPDEVAAEQPVPGFTDLAAMAHPVGNSVWAELSFDGDLFETEDQRNWIDASFKTFCRPLRLPKPYTLQRGARVRQEVTLRLRPTPSPVFTAPGISPGAQAPSAVRLRVPASSDFVRLPEIGLAMASHGRPLKPSELELLSRLQLSHLRTEIRLAGCAWQQELGRARAEAADVGLGLELVVIGDPQRPDAWQDLRSALTRARVDLSRILPLEEGEPSTTEAALAAARAALGDFAAPLGAGTDGDLYQLHLHPPAAGADFIAWSMNPQTHAFDHRSILETPTAVPDQLRTVAARHPGLGRVVSPISLRPRQRASDNASSADPRQKSLFAAAWTAGMLAALLPARLDAVTLFETTGPLGVMPDDPAQAPHGTSAREGAGVFPVYHVLRALQGARHCAPALAENHADIVSIALDNGRAGGIRILVANLSSEPREISWPAGVSFSSTRSLDPTSAPSALRDPESFWRDANPASPGAIPGFGILIADIAAKMT
jgi:hypothetical protein